VCGYRSLEIENSKGERFTVAHEGCKSIVYGAQAYSISGQRRRLSELGVERFRLDFLTRPYQELEFEKVITLVQGDHSVPETHAANFLGQLK
jgi:hypothetical protein